MPSIAALQLAIVGVRFFGISRGVFRYLERYVSHRLTFNILARLRVWLYERLEPLAPARLLNYRSGDLLTRIVADVETLEKFFVRVIAPPLVAVLVGLLMGGLMALFDARLVLLTWAFLAVAGVALPVLTHLLSRGLGERTIHTRAELNVALVDGIQGVADIVTAGQENQHRERIRVLSANLVKAQERLAWVAGLQTAASTLLNNWATIAVLILSIPLVHAGKLEGVFLAVIVLGVMASFEAVLPLPETIQQMDDSTAAARRLFELIDAEPTVTAPDGPSPTPAHHHLELSDVVLTYDQHAPPALRGLSLSLREGEHKAIVGPSGAGKTSLINVLLRFWDYQSGDIRLGGHSLRAYHPDDARAMFSVVSQHTHLFNGTVRENLLIARPSASDDDLIAATQQAQLHDFIESLPQGYETWIGEQGLRFSGGERQRLAIARALLHNAPILILDEPTANLDPLVEQELLHTLKTVMAQRTTLMITHRLVGLAVMDEILVLHQGRIAERGQHADLVQAGGLYARLCNMAL